ncbi:uncharacterized protein K460DRAFT_365581 [Cucurbitaria berberidis CBS 394.84]|uniref:Acireductone synthase n=1 Tax=Cucurbitaria berberidis CBS 394.84 TaxID=1168544 RepID=A0A9P4GFY4_9PLEO|nr:uncharacterized protein K460DRAFT_365581 [Cucurbitaria berberidis CBS 394.84]KAF1844647.1 hypothetical protein K460DRAFT_365581 [Cucurbitaria berberidis CBS 394.84]
MCTKLPLSTTVHRWLLVFVCCPFAPTSAEPRHTTTREGSIGLYIRKFSLHRYSPPYTQQENNAMSAASLDGERWRESDVVLLDIEGTISSISFVKDVMYPYALDSLTRLARDQWADAGFQALIAGFPEETRRSADTLVAHVEDLTRRDIKAVYLKQLQGGC